MDLRLLLVGRRRRTLGLALLAVLVLLGGAAYYFFFLRMVWEEKTLTLHITAGSVAVERVRGAGWQDVPDGTLLYAGDWVWVKEHSAALLGHPDGSISLVEGVARFYVDESRGWRKHNRITLNLAQGRTSHWVAPLSPPSHFSIQTESASLFVEGTVFEAEVDAVGQSRFQVSEGRLRVGAVTVSNEGELVIALVALTPGESLTAGAAPTEIRGQPVMEDLRQLARDITQQAVQQEEPVVGVKGAELTVTDPSSGSALYTVVPFPGLPSRLAIPLAVPVPTAPGAGPEDQVLSLVPALSTGYEPVLAVPPPPTAPGVAAPPMPTPAPEEPPRYLFSIYDIAAPLGVAVDSGGQRLYVTETAGERVTRMFDMDGNFLGVLAPPDTTPAARMPVYVTVAPDGTVYVSDRRRHRIDMYDAAGNYLGTFAPNGIPNAAWSPLALTVDRAGNLYATEISQGLHSVVVFDPAGMMILEFGTEGDGLGEFSFPNGVVVDGNGGIFVADSNNWRLQVFTAGGKLVDVFREGNRPAPVGLPRGLAIDAHNRLYVVDTLGHRVQVYRIGGPVRLLFSLGVFGDGDGEFQYPNGVAVDQAGRVYVTDRENNRVQVWGY